jgi:hypothetical protein
MILSYVLYGLVVLSAFVIVGIFYTLLFRESGRERDEDIRSK